MEELPAHRHRLRAITIACAALVFIPIACTATVIAHHGTSQQAAPIPRFQAVRNPHLSEVQLPITGLNWPTSVAVDTAESVYVTDTNNKRVIKLPAGSSTPVELPFTGPKRPESVAVDNPGNVYVIETTYTGLTSTNRVLKLPAGSSTPIQLPFTGLKDPAGMAVDSAGNIYIADNGKSPLPPSAQSTAVAEHPFAGIYIADSNGRVLKLPAGSGAPVLLPFARLQDPTGVAVDTAGNVYVADKGNSRVLKLLALTNAVVELPSTGLRAPAGVAVDTACNVYITDNGNSSVPGSLWARRVLQLPAQSSTWVELPFTGLSVPAGVAVDRLANVYVTDLHSNRVLKLPAG